MKNSQITVNPYLNFNGNSEEVMNFYKSVVGGELEIMRFGEAPINAPTEAKNKVMHATLVFEGAVVMAADSMPGQEIIVGNNNAISLNAPTLEDAKRIYEGLSEGGKILIPFDKMFWGDMFGMFVDKYGIQWMVHFGLTQ